MEKTCSMCKQIKPFNKFQGESYYCRICYNIYSKDRYHSESIICSCGSIVNLIRNKKHLTTKRHIKGVLFLQKMKLIINQTLISEEQKKQ